MATVVSIPELSKILSPLLDKLYETESWQNCEHCPNLVLVETDDDPVTLELWSDTPHQDWLYGEFYLDGEYSTLCSDGETEEGRVILNFFLEQPNPVTGWSELPHPPSFL